MKHCETNTVGCRLPYTYPLKKCHVISLPVLSDSSCTIFLKLLCPFSFDVKEEYPNNRVHCALSAQNRTPDIAVLSLRLALIFVLDGEVTGLRCWVL